MKMMGYSFAVTSVVLALFAANVSTDEGTCDVDYRLHENLSSVLRNPVGVGMLNDVARNVADMCMDPAAHNSQVKLLDALIDVSTDKTVAQTLGNVFFWTRKLIKDPYFRAAWDETMRGLSVCFDRHADLSQLTDTVFDKLDVVLNHPKFDDVFESVVQRASMFTDVHKKIAYGAGALLAKPMGGKRSVSNVQRRNSARSTR
ncbi:uncharacterized protein LOC112681619 [Sipha flava]|uniref:Uncharacterized protein LOC112681619 n=1 Tax=Sipha flava TaxID=143950 RepID=A0A8B8FA27_9HEMI|nr:uncharacterized protein LOC112681619 [Sipha flava]